MVDRHLAFPLEPALRRTMTALVVASALTLAGCGAGEDERATESISAYLMDQQESQGEFLDLEQGDADCIAEGMVDGVGVEKLQEYGLLTEDGTVAEDTTATDMSLEDAETTADAMFDCTDVMSTMRDQLAASMGEQPAEVQECFDEALTEEAVRGILVAGLTGNQDEAGQELMAPLMECAVGDLGLLPEG